MERKMSHESKNFISEFNFYSIVEWELKRHTYYKLFYSWKENVARNVFIIKIISYIDHLQGHFSGLISQVKPAVKSNSQFATLAFSESLSSPSLRISQVYSSYWGKKNCRELKLPQDPRCQLDIRTKTKKPLCFRATSTFLSS